MGVSRIASHQNSYDSRLDRRLDRTPVVVFRGGNVPILPADQREAVNVSASLVPVGFVRQVEPTPVLESGALEQAVQLAPPVGLTLSGLLATFDGVQTIPEFVAAFCALSP